MASHKISHSCSERFGEGYSIKKCVGGPVLVAFTLHYTDAYCMHISSEAKMISPTTELKIICTPSMNLELE